MELRVAKSLIQQAVNLHLPVQVWADLGAGDGLFTSALADILPTASTVIALDRDVQALKRISISRTDVKLTTVTADLNHLPSDLPLFDGVVMANSLHYVRDQSHFLMELKKSRLKESGTLILIEYDLEKSNPWVPYPISRKNLISLASKSGFGIPVFINSVKSRLNSSEIYSALLKPNR